MKPIVTHALLALLRLLTFVAWVLLPYLAIFALDWYLVDIPGFPGPTLVVLVITLVVTGYWVSRLPLAVLAAHRLRTEG